MVNASMIYIKAEGEEMKDKRMMAVKREMEAKEDEAMRRHWRYEDKEEQMREKYQTGMKKKKKIIS